MAGWSVSLTLERQSELVSEIIGRSSLPEIDLQRESIPISDRAVNCKQHQASISEGNIRWRNQQSRGSDQPGGDRVHDEQVILRNIDVTSGQISGSANTEVGLLSLLSSEVCESMERPPAMAGRSRNGPSSTTTELVIATFNCTNGSHQ